MPEQLTVDQIEMKKFTTADLRRLAEEEMAQQAALPAGQQLPQQEEQAQEEQPRDDQGRFVKKEAEAASADQEEQDSDESERKTIYRQVIDLGDGGGVQVFEADSLEELVEKLTKAQTNATKKIREQEAELKRKREAEEQVDKDTEFVISQEMMQNPTVAFKKMIKATTGMDFEEFKTTIVGAKQLNENQRKQIIVNNFLASHPDYDDTAKNGKLMQKFMGSEFTADSFEKAYRELKADGLLDLKTEEAHSGQETTRPVEKRIAEQQTEEVPPQRIARKSSGLSTKARPSPAPKQKTPEELEAELYSMPMEELRRLGMSQK